MSDVTTFIEPVLHFKICINYTKDFVEKVEKKRITKKLISIINKGILPTALSRKNYLI